MRRRQSRLGLRAAGITGARGGTTITGKPVHALPATAGAAAVFTRGQRLALLAGFALLVALRLPRTWTHGRFLDEEGTIFFAYGWHRPALDALFRSFGGYLNLAANGVALVDARLVQAGVLPLLYAPYFTMLAALGAQLVPAALLLTARGRWLASRWAVVAALLILAISAATEEVFLNVLHIQFHLALAAALILALDVPARRGTRLAYHAILFLAPLCGPGAIILAPFFALRALVERTAGRIAQAVALGAGTALQLLVFFQPSPARGAMLSPVELASLLFVRLVLLPFRGFSRANRLGTGMYESYAAGGSLWWWGAVALVAWFALLTVLALRDRRDAAAWLIVPALAIGLVSFGGGMIVASPRDWFSVGAGERYNYLPLLLSMLGLVALARRPSGIHRPVCIVLCVLMLVLSAKRYPKPIKELKSGPDWSIEVAKWQRDHDYHPLGWPADWPLDLSDRDRPCSPPARPGAGDTDPNYCESVWLARVMRHVRHVRSLRP